MPCNSSTCIDRSGNLGLLLFCTLVNTIKGDVFKKGREGEGGKEGGREGHRHKVITRDRMHSSQHRQYLFWILVLGETMLLFRGKGVAYMMPAAPIEGY